ncbi:MAG: hypothetical protein ACTHJJ_10795 [Intrasporangium sp.]|uniref:hypothetical protein n=1 Tax=Intrasporangium sp. TaxID=1925024 RepID=UPI003F81D075
MAVRLITYDLKRPGRTYAKLQDEIKSAGDWWHYLDSTWLVDTSLTCNALADRLHRHTSTGDCLLVVDVSRDEKQGWLPQDAWEWINRHW